MVELNTKASLLVCFAVMVSGCMTELSERPMIVGEDERATVTTPGPSTTRFLGEAFPSLPIDVIADLSSRTDAFGHSPINDSLIDFLPMVERELVAPPLGNTIEDDRHPASSENLNETDDSQTSMEAESVEDEDLDNSGETMPDDSESEGAEESTGEALPSDQSDSFDEDTDEFDGDMGDGTLLEFNQDEEDEETDGLNEGPSGEAALRALGAYLELQPEARPDLLEEDFIDEPLTHEEATHAVSLLWDDYKRRQEVNRRRLFRANQIIVGDKIMPFVCDTDAMGMTPKHTVFINLHGGGNVSAAINDSEWHRAGHRALVLPQDEHGIYCAPRAPTNHWNLWHQDHIDDMLGQLIRDLIIFKDADPDRIFLMGGGAGGDGVYQLAPRMADRFAAAATWAGHPNDAKPDGLRNLPFIIRVGAQDASYNRNSAAEEWGHLLAELHSLDRLGYHHEVHLVENASQNVRLSPNDMIFMTMQVRNPTPSRVIWRQSTRLHEQFYWLSLPDRDDRKANETIVADLVGQTAVIASTTSVEVQVWLNDRMIDMDTPIEIKDVFDGILFRGQVERTIGAIYESIEARGDPNLIFFGRVRVDVDQ